MRIVTNWTVDFFASLFIRPMLVFSSSLYTHSMPISYARMVIYFVVMFYSAVLPFSSSYFLSSAPTALFTRIFYANVIFSDSNFFTALSFSKRTRIAIATDISYKPSRHRVNLPHINRFFFPHSNS